MGRHAKIVNTESGIDRRETGYYETPDFIAEFIDEILLKLNPKGRYLLDPCVGRGEMVLPFLRKGISVDGIDVISFGLPDEVSFRQEDFLLDFYRVRKIQCIFGSGMDLIYDFYVANPPYNCHELSYIRRNKGSLKNLFEGIGVHNMYSMFLAALVDCAKEGASIGVITSDSFLTAKAHACLRRRILRECSIHYLILCPTDLFLDQGADVRTCIMILQKGKQYQRGVRVGNRPLDTFSLRKMLESKDFSEVSLNEIVLAEVADNSEFIIGVPDEIRRLFSFPRLGGLFPCVTGISTGNDRKYLSKEKRSGFSIPFYKNPGSRRFFTWPNAYLRDDFLLLDRHIKNFMVRNKHLLFKPGITCSSMGVPFAAAYLPANSTYGVNTNIITEERDTWWLLGYLNSSLVTFIVRGVLLRSNMITAGYVFRIPIPNFSAEVKGTLAKIAKQAYEEKVSLNDAEKYVTRVDNVLRKELCLTDQTVEVLKYFSQNLVRAT